MKKLKGLCISVFFLLVICTTIPVYAASVTYSVDINGGAFNMGFMDYATPNLSLGGDHLGGSLEGELPLFNPSLGTLRYVTIGASSTYVLNGMISGVPNSYLTQYPDGRRWYVGGDHSIEGTLSSQGTVTVNVPVNPLGYGIVGSSVNSPILTQAVPHVYYNGSYYETLELPENSLTISTNEPVYNMYSTGYWSANSSGVGSYSASYSSIPEIDQFIGSGSFPVAVFPSIDEIFTQTSGPDGHYNFSTTRAMIFTKVTVNYQYGLWFPYDPPFPFGSYDPPPAIIPPGFGGVTPSVNDPDFCSYYLPQQNSVPEPATLLLLGLGLVGLAGARRRLNRRKAS